MKRLTAILLLVSGLAFGQATAPTLGRTNTWTAPNTWTAAETHNGAATHTGAETFTTPPTVPTPANPTDAANKAYADTKADAAATTTALATKALDSAVVHNTGDETIAGIKTLTGKFETKDPYLDVRAFGAKGDGSTDDTAAINAACAAAAGKIVYFPAGNYPYSGVGCTGTQMKFRGDGPPATTITLGAGKYFIDDNQVWTSLWVVGIHFEAGAGAIRNRQTSSNVVSSFVVADNEFINYTGAAISHNASDMPYWKFNRDVFRGANDTTTIGLALSGLTDSVTISDCAFERNKAHIKLGQGGNNAHIINSDFYQWAAGTGRASIWIVPNASASNSGNGFTVQNVKFGSENLDASDFRILYADEGAGTYFGDRLWVTTASTGFITGHHIGPVNVSGTGSTKQSVVYSYTPNIQGSAYGPITMSGTPLSEVLHLDAGILPLARSTTCQSCNQIGPVRMASTSFSSNTDNGWVATNGVGIATVTDPDGVLQESDTAQIGPWIAGTSQAGFLNLETTAINSYTLLGSATKSVITDAVGGSDAAELTIPQFGLVKRILTATPTVGFPIWIEFDMKVGSTSPLTSVKLACGKDSGAAVQYQRVLAIPSAWRRFRFMYTPREVFGSPDMQCGFGNSAAASGTVQVGRVHVYQAFEPVSGGQFVDGVQPAATGTAITWFQKATHATLDLASVATAACTAETSETITGAALGDHCDVDAGSALQAGGFFACHVTAADTVKWQFCNLSGGAIDRASDTYTIRVLR